VILDSLGRLNGNGTIIGNVFNAGSGGTIAPGRDAPGLISITGNYTQNGIPEDIFDVQLGGTGAGQFSVLNVDGDVHLGGTLEAELFGGFAPTSGDTFDILHVTGTFDDLLTNFLLPGLANGLSWQVLDLNNDHDLVLEVTRVAVAEPASLLLLINGLIAIVCVARKPLRRSRL